MRTNQEKIWALQLTAEQLSDSLSHCAEAPSWLDILPAAGDGTKSLRYWSGLSWADGINKNERHFFLAVIHDENRSRVSHVVGMLEAYFHQDKQNLNLSHVSVDAAYRRQGIATSLYEAFADFAMGYPDVMVTRSYASVHGGLDIQTKMDAILNSRGIAWRQSVEGCSDEWRTSSDDNYPPWAASF